MCLVKVNNLKLSTSFEHILSPHSPVSPALGVIILSYSPEPWCRHYRHVPHYYLLNSGKTFLHCFPYHIAENFVSFLSSDLNPNSNVLALLKEIGLRLSTLSISLQESLFVIKLTSKKDCVYLFLSWETGVRRMNMHQLLFTLCADL